MANLNKRQSRPHLNQSVGFTLIETFVAITVLVIAVLGPMTLLSKALQNSRYIKDEIVATYLAQEGVELMINNRNNEGGSQLVSGTAQPPYSCQLYLDTNNQGYNCDSKGAPTIFTRTVKVDQIAGTEQYTITSTVERISPPEASKKVTSSSIIFK